MSKMPPPVGDYPTRENAQAGAPPFQKSARGGKSYPLSFAQERLWYVAQLENGSAAYNVTWAWRLTGPLDVAALEQSVNEIISRHEPLRTVFPVMDGQAVQSIEPERALALPIMDLRALVRAEQEAEVQRLAAEEARRPFDLTSDPLLRARLLWIENEEHVFLLTVHHIVCDGWSMGVFFNELEHIYESFSSGKPSPLPELSIHYGDIAVWQREQLKGEVLQKQLIYWKRQLKGLAALELPADRPRPPLQTFRGGTQYFALSKTLSDDLRALSGREEVTLFTTLLAAFQTLFYRYTRQDDIVVGAPVCCRRRFQFQRLIGLFINLVALRADFSANPTFRELLKQARKIVLEANQHADLPFEKLVEELRPVRDPSRNPLFQVVLNQTDPTWLALRLEGLRTTPLQVDNGKAAFDLSLYLVEDPAGIRGWLEYSSDLFDAATVTRMLGHLQVLLESVVTDPEQRVSQLPLLTQAERHRLLVEWNDTQADYPQAACIHHLFEDQVERIPAEAAVITEDTHLTYRQLNRRSNQLAHYLRKLGVKSETPVGISMERSSEMVVGLMGILKAGGAYLPLDPAYPRERLAFMLKDAEVKVLLTQERFAKALGPHGARVVCLDREWGAIARESEHNPPREGTADSVAYVIYTSGSTGTPKGVLGLHRGALNRFEWMRNKYPFEAGEVCCAKTSLSFVDSVWETFGPLLAGVPTLIVSDTVLKNPQILVQTLRAHRVTRLVLVPSLLRTLLDNVADLERLLPRLKYWMSSGETLEPVLVRRFREVMPGRILINLYGSTEVSADVTYYNTRDGKALESVSIGRPIANTKVYILDRQLQPVPVGVRGELYIGGAGLARGYLNRPEQTAEKFILSPFGELPGARLYRTGDLGRYRPDGNIEFLGRADHQVKIRGFRIELEEIEAVLKGHPALRQAALALREDGSDEKRIVAYVELNPDHEGPIEPELRLYLQGRMPDYMLPAVIMTLDRLPLSPSGKIDRRSLPPPSDVRGRLERSYVQAQTDLERTLEKLWRELLHTDKVGTHDNFFDLGGHSLLLVKAQSNLKEILGREVTMIDLFRCPTISSLAEFISRRDGDQVSFRHVQDRVRKQKEALRRRTEILDAGLR